MKKNERGHDGKTGQEKKLNLHNPKHGFFKATLISPTFQVLGE